MLFYSVLPWKSKVFCSSQWFIQGGYLEKKQFFHRWDQKRGFNLSTLRNTFQHLVLLKFHHALNFFSKFLLLPWCTATPFYSKRASYFFHLKDSSMKDILKRSNFFTDETKKVVLTCLRWETRSDNYYYWNFTMHSVSSSNFFLRPWCTSTPFFTKRARHFVHLKKSGFNQSTLRNTFQHSLLLKFYHALIIFIKSPFAAPVQLYSVLLSTRARFSVHLSESSEGVILKRSSFFTDET